MLHGERDEYHTHFALFSRVHLSDGCVGASHGMQQEDLDVKDAYAILSTYYHSTLHRRAVVPLDLPSGARIEVRAGPETPETVRELRSGLKRASALTYVFMRRGFSMFSPCFAIDVDGCGVVNDVDVTYRPRVRPSLCHLDALLVLLTLAAAYPRKVLLLREENASELAPGSMKIGPFGPIWAHFRKILLSFMTQMNIAVEPIWTEQHKETNVIYPVSLCDL